MNKDEVANRLRKASDTYIKKMIAAVSAAYQHDSRLSDQQKERFQQFGQDGVYFGTDVFSDWTEWSEMLKQEADRRGMNH
jgi:hypothetical protein